MDQKLTNSIVDRLATKLVDFHQRRITNAAPSVDQYDYVVRKELHELAGTIKQELHQTPGASSKDYYTIVYTKGDTVSTAEMCPDFIVGDGREGSCTEAWLRCKVTPSTHDLEVNFEVAGATLLGTNLIIPMGSLGPVFIRDILVTSSMAAGTIVTPVIVNGDGVAAFVTAGVVVKRT